MNRSIVWLIVSLMIVCSGCAGTSMPKEPGEAALKQVKWELSRRVRQAEQIANSPPYRGVYLRINHAKGCVSPDYELYLEGKWQRVYVVDEEGMRPELERRAAERTPITANPIYREERIGFRPYPAYRINLDDRTN